MSNDVTPKGSYHKTDERRIRALQRMLDEQGPLHFSRLLKEALLRETKKTYPASKAVTSIDSVLESLQNAEKE